MEVGKVDKNHFEFKDVKKKRVDIWAEIGLRLGCCGKYAFLDFKSWFSS